MMILVISNCKFCGYCVHESFFIKEVTTDGDCRDEWKAMWQVWIKKKKKSYITQINNNRLQITGSWNIQL